MTNNKCYCEKNENLAQMAKALGHPARIAIMKFLAQQETCYFGAINEPKPLSASILAH